MSSYKYDMIRLKVYICHLRVMIRVGIYVLIRVVSTGGGASESDGIRNIGVGITGSGGCARISGNIVIVVAGWLNFDGIVNGWVTRDICGTNGEGGGAVVDAGKSGGRRSGRRRGWSMRSRRGRIILEGGVQWMTA